MPRMEELIVKEYQIISMSISIILQTDQNFYN